MTALSDERESLAAATRKLDISVKERDELRSAMEEAKAKVKRQAAALAE